VVPFARADFNNAGWGNGYTNYSVTVPTNWPNTCAAKVTKLFGDKFFALEAKRTPEFDTKGNTFHWVHRAERTKNIGLKVPETGYLVHNEHNDFAFGTTPEVAEKNLNTAIAKKAKAILLGDINL